MQNISAIIFLLETVLYSKQSGGYSLTPHQKAIAFKWAQYVFLILQIIAFQGMQTQQPKCKCPENDQSMGPFFKSNDYM